MPYLKYVHSDSISWCLFFTMTKLSHNWLNANNLRFNLGLNFFKAEGQIQLGEFEPFVTRNLNGVAPCIRRCRDTRNKLVKHVCYYCSDLLVLIISKHQASYQWKCVVYCIMTGGYQWIGMVSKFYWEVFDTTMAVFLITLCKMECT